jgi:histidyl-tRNA synthetase
LALIEDAGLAPAPTPPDVYAIVPDPESLPSVIAALEALREVGLKVQMHSGGVEGPGRFKAQFKKADASGASYALVFGADELARGEVAVKALRDAGMAQVSRPLSKVAQWAASLLPGAPDA